MEVTGSRTQKGNQQPVGGPLCHPRCDGSCPWTLRPGPLIKCVSLCFSPSFFTRGWAGGWRLKRTPHQGSETKVLAP